MERSMQQCCTNLAPNGPNCAKGAWNAALFLGCPVYPWLGKAGPALAWHQKPMSGHLITSRLQTSWLKRHPPWKASPSKAKTSVATLERDRKGAFMKIRTRPPHVLVRHANTTTSTRSSASQIPTAHNIHIKLNYPALNFNAVGNAKLRIPTATQAAATFPMRVVHKH